MGTRALRIPECEISICDVTVGPCEWNGETSEYNLSLKVIWSGAPSGELLKVVVGGQTYTIDPSVTTSPAIINFTFTADGEYETISAMFTGNYNCGDTYCYNSPDDCKPADCNLEVDDVIVGYCNWDAELSESIYNISFVLTWANAPAGDKIEVTVDGNVQTIDPALVTSPQTLTLPDLLPMALNTILTLRLKAKLFVMIPTSFGHPTLVNRLAT